MDRLAMRRTHHARDLTTGCCITPQWNE